MLRRALQQWPKAARPLLQQGRGAVMPRIPIFVQSRSMADGKTIAPKDEFAGQATVEVAHEAPEFVPHPRGSPLHTLDRPIATEDAPWTPKGALNKSPMELINDVPPIPVDGNRIRCEGGSDPRMGHPVVYMNLDNTSVDNPETCLYCGLRYYNAKKKH